jgi:signal transduction histidine kinase
LNIYKSQVELKKIFDELYDIVEVERDRLGKNDVKIIKNLPDNSSFLMETDEMRLKQVLYNLLTNALKFTEKGQIAFGYNKQKDKVNFYVKDTGTGIPKNIQHVIFDRFRQGNIDQSAKIAGTGLGLAISKGIVELLGGKISVISKENAGSEFYFEIPC